MPMDKLKAIGRSIAWTARTSAHWIRMNPKLACAIGGFVAGFVCGLQL